MQYSLRFTFLANQGKLAELRQVLEETARDLHTQGFRAAVHVPVVSLHGQSIYTQISFDSLADFKAFRESPSPERVNATLALQAKLAGLLREPRSPDLYEVLLPPQTTDWTPRYIGRVTWTPLPGKQIALRELALENARARQAQGRRLGVAVQMAGSQAGAIMQSNLFANLEDWESNRANNVADPQFQKRQEQFGAMSAGPQTVELLEVVVPLPARG